MVSHTVLLLEQTLISMWDVQYTTAAMIYWPLYVQYNMIISLWLTRYKIARTKKADDSVFEQTRVDVIGAFTSPILLNHQWNAKIAQWRQGTANLSGRRRKEKTRSPRSSAKKHFLNITCNAKYAMQCIECTFNINTVRMGQLRRTTKNNTVH